MAVVVFGLKNKNMKLKKIKSFVVIIKNKLFSTFSIMGKVKYQKFFEWLNKLSLTGMNVGTGEKISKSGEIKVLKHINKHFKSSNNLILFDVGANIGNYSIILNKIFNKKAKIHSFEPSKNIYKKLLTKLGNEENIFLYNFGFGNKNEKKPLYSNPDRLRLTSIYKRKLDHFNIDMNQKEEVEIKTIDSFCKENNIQHINFLKLDVEGHEKKILEGSREMIDSKNIDFIQFEFGGCNIDSRTYFQNFYYLLKDKYKIYRIMRDGLYEIKQYKETYEIFITTNYLAEKII